MTALPNCKDASLLARSNSNTFSVDEQRRQCTHANKFIITDDADHIKVQNGANKSLISVSCCKILNNDQCSICIKDWSLLPSQLAYAVRIIKLAVQAISICYQGSSDMQAFVDSHSVLHLPKRAHSIFTRPSMDSVFSNQENLKNHYQLYMQRRQPYNNKSPQGSASTTSLQSSKRPTISWLLRDRLLIDEQLRTTINKQRYERLKAQKKFKYLMRKKNKYEAVLRIRKQNNLDRIKLDRMKTNQRNKISQEQITRKNQIWRARRTLSDSMSRSLAQKKQTAYLLKQRQLQDMKIIAKNRQHELKHKKRMHSQILQQEKKMYFNRSNDISTRNSIGIENYLQRLENQLSKNEKLEKNRIKKQISMQKRRMELRKAKEFFDQKIQLYSAELHEYQPITLFRSKGRKTQTIKTEGKWVQQTTRQ